MNVTDSTVTMRLNAGNGGYLDFNYKLLPHSYMVDFSVQAVGMKNFFSSSTKTMNIDWSQRARQMEKGYTFEQRYTSLTYKPVDDSSDYLSETKPFRKHWIGLLSRTSISLVYSSLKRLLKTPHWNLPWKLREADT